MNYRHAFHAGNFADVFKHLLLTRVIAYLQRKPAGFFYLDTHAGIGRYDLASDAAERGGEWAGGVGRFVPAAAGAPAAVAELIEPYRAMLAAMNGDGTLHHVPGSPRVMHAMRRPQDRLSLCELHRDDVQLLADEFRGASGVKVHHLDGWLALKAQLPPKEKRSLVLIDPPFEARDEFDTMAAHLEAGLQRHATGTFCCWYPLKHREAASAFADAIAGLGRPWLVCDLSVGSPVSTTGRRTLDGCGMAVINPPYALPDELATMMPWLVSVLENAPGQGSWSLRHDIS